MHPRLVVVPQHLPVGIQPLASELLSSWLRRVADANATTLEELLAAVSRADSIFSDDNMGFDYQLPEEIRQRLSVFCRIPAATIAELEIRNAFVGHRPEWFYGRPTTPYRPHLNPPFCLLCLAEQVRSGCPLHVQAAWAVPVFTHCTSHLWRFQASCNSCWTNDPMEWLATGRHQPILCKHCSQPLTTKLDKAPPGKSFLTIVSLEAAILAASRGSSPDTFWAGSTSAECFMQMIGDLIHLLTHRESGQGSMAAKQVAPEEFRCACPLPRGVEQPALFTLHHAVRVMIMAAVASFLLGRQSPSFFPSATPIACERPSSYHQLTDSEFRFVEAHLAEWPKQLQIRLSSFCSERPGHRANSRRARDRPVIKYNSVRLLSTILSGR
jgi:TniQ